MFRYLLFVSILGISACSTEVAESSGPIPQEALVEIIAESLIIEPAGREFAKIIQDSIYDLHYGKILEQRGFTQEEFISSMQFLQKDPKKLEAVYEEVLEHLQIIETEVGN